MFLFDTDTLSNVLSRDPSTALLVRLAAVPPRDQYTTAITVGEMVYGANRSARRDYLLKQFEERIKALKQSETPSRKLAERPLVNCKKRL